MLTKRGSLVAVAAATTALLVGAAAAQAATTFTVRAGTAKPGTQVAFAAKSKSVTLSDVKSGFTVTCTGAAAPGITHTGKHGGAGIARLNGGNAKFKNCSAFSGMLTATPKGVGRWLFNAHSVKKGVVSGSLSRVHLNVSASLGCSYTVQGHAPARYIDSKHALQVLSRKAELTVSNASTGCNAAVTNGDKASLRGRFVLHAAKQRFNPITIRS